MPHLRATHTYAVLEVSQAAHDEIAELLLAAGYGLVFHEDAEHDIVLVMTGIALAKKENGQ